MGRNHISLFLSRGQGWPEHHMFLITVLNLLVYIPWANSCSQRIDFSLYKHVLPKNLGILVSIFKATFFPLRKGSEHYLAQVWGRPEGRGAHRKVPNTSGQDRESGGVERQSELHVVRRWENVTMGRGREGSQHGKVVPQQSLGGGQPSAGREAQKRHSRQWW